ncbi:MAG: hypothetical protein J5I93_18545 [Pirellulaceae bacterium]|nr:hypothetical protein [Pirellulaceae bacterium]
MEPRCLRTLFRVLGSLLVCSTYSSTLVGQQPEPVRTYAQGPLTADDFRGQPPDQAKLPGGNLPALAYTATELRYDCRYRLVRRDRTWTAWLTQLDAVAVLKRDECWILRKEDRRLMDHEQGHFDLAQIWAERAEAGIKTAIERGELRESRATEQAAIDALQAAIDRKMETYRQGLVAADRDYDQVTRYGTLAGQQAEQRGRHTELLRASAAPSVPANP